MACNFWLYLSHFICCNSSCWHIYKSILQNSRVAANFSFIFQCSSHEFKCVLRNESKRNEENDHVEIKPDLKCLKIWQIEVTIRMLEYRQVNLQMLLAGAHCTYTRPTDIAYFSAVCQKCNRQRFSERKSQCQRDGKEGKGKGNEEKEVPRVESEERRA